MDPNEIDARLKAAWDEVRAYFRRRQEGSATAAEDPQPRIAAELFDLWLAERDTPGMERALGAAFRMWGNAGRAEEVDRALALLDVHAPYWGAVLHGAWSAYARVGRGADVLPLLHRHEGVLTHPRSVGALCGMLGMHLMRAGEPDRAAPYWERVAALAADPDAVYQAKGMLYEIEHLRPGRPAPPVSGRTLDSGEVRLPDPRSRVVCLAFWSPDCGFCGPEMSFLREIRPEHPEDELLLVGVCRGKDEAELRETVERERLHWPQVREPPAWRDGRLVLGPIFEAYNAQGIPRSVLIARDGKIVAIDLRGEALAKAVREEVARSSGGRASA